MTTILNALKKLNRNQLMLLIGLVVAEGPDVAAVANLLASSGIPHLTGAVHFLGWLSTALASAAIAWPSIRSKLASFGLTTPPGALAPWIPGKPGDPLVAGDAAGKVLPKQTGEPTPVTENIRPKDKGAINHSVLLVVCLLSACVGTFAMLKLSRADGLVLNLSDTWTCSPVAALTGEQLNLKTQTFQQGVSLGAGYGCRYTGWKQLPLAIEAVGGFAANSNAPNAIQGNLIFVAADNYGIGPGAQVFKDPVSGDYVGQMPISFFLTASWAATTEQLKAVRVEARAEGAKAAR